MKKMLFLVLFVSMVGVFYAGNTSLAEETPLYGFVPPESLQVVSARFSADPYSKSNYDPFIKVDVYNDSPQVITRAFIRFKITCDNDKREIFSEKFLKVCSGGMPAYSSAVWLFYPRNSSFWALHNLPYDSQISATVEKVFCPKKNSPWQHEFKSDYPTRHDMYF